MANWKKVDADQLDADLTSVADAIRERSGTSEQMNFPDGFVSAVDLFTEQFIKLLNGTITTINFPKSLTSIRTSAFANCNGLQISTFPEGLKNIYPYAFQNCFGIKQITFPSTLTNLSNLAFANCANLNTVTFKSTPSIGASAFSSCSELTTINVPWAEGEVANAPWGATKATINYNYVAEG